VAIILHIDTSAAVAAVSISTNGLLSGFIQNEDQKEHASFLQPAIKKLLLQLELKIEDLDAVAAVNGPGSYTGLRVGLASAKGICYAAKKRLLTVGSLPLMAKSALIELQTTQKDVPLLCPMIDARRMEVFTAVYNSTLEEIIPAQPMLINNLSFVEILLQKKLLFFGTGAPKFKEICTHPNAIFAGQFNSLQAFCEIAHTLFKLGQFTDLAYSEPLYLKEFYTGN
jgi:tRNA threonylcarbamoyladenosine biosynthesis protein TsaB